MKTLRLTVHVISDDRTRWQVSNDAFVAIVQEHVLDVASKLTKGSRPAVAVRLVPPPAHPHSASGCYRE